MAEAKVSSDPETEVKLVSRTPDFKLSTSTLDKVLLSISIVLFVSVCDPVKVATVESMAKETVFSAPTVVIPVPPFKVKVSLSRSIESTPPLSAWKSKSWAVTCASIYVFKDCCVARAVAESLERSSSSKIDVTVDPLLKDKLVMPLTVPPFISTVLSAVILQGKVIQASLPLLRIFITELLVSTHNS